MRVAGKHRIADQFAVLRRQVQAVFAHQGIDFELESDLHGAKGLPDLRRADLVVAFVIEIDLVDGAAGRDDEQFLDHGWCPVPLV